MDVLEEKFSIYRDVILSDLDVSDDLLQRMLDGSLLDAAESAKYKAIEDAQEKNLELMTAMIERRTDRAYPILLDCLRGSGQDRIADLLTDVTADTAVDKHEPDDLSKPSPPPPSTQKVDSPACQIPSEMDSVRQVNANLDALLKDLSPFLDIEERRIGLETTTPRARTDEKEKETSGSAGEDGSTEAESQQAERQLWHSVHDTMVSAITEIGRCQNVIKKLHQDCQTVADINSEITAQIKDCDSMIRKMLRTHRLPANEVSPQRTTDLFQILMDNIHALIETRNRIMQREKETRSMSMRMLRTLRDILDVRCQVLSDLHATSTRRLRYAPSSTRLSVNSPAMTSLNTSPAVSRQGDVLPSLALSRQTLGDVVESRPFSSVHDGLSQLDHQLKDYVKLETFLTDRYKGELRVKQLQKKAQGYTSKGFYNVKQYVDNIERGVDVEESLHLLRGVLVKLSEEYDQCVHYMKRITGKTESLKPEPKKSLFGRKKQTPPVPALILPKLVPENTFSNLDPQSESTRGKPLLLRLKTFVSNYESLKESEQTLKEKVRQESERKRKELIDVIRKKEEEIQNIHVRLAEMTADRDKYRKLYDQAKASFGRKAKG